MFSYPAEWPVCYNDVECPDPGITTANIQLQGPYLNPPD